MCQTIIQNPIIWADVPDVDVIRVGEAFYMVSTSMHSMPGCPIMKSTDLAHWQLVNYVFDTFEDNPGHNLEDGKGIYGNGSWAASLKEHDGMFYVAFNCNDTHHFYIYKTDDIENGPWKRCAKVEGFLHDPALFFEDDGTPYVIYGCGEIHIVEFEKDLSGIKKGTEPKLLFSTPKEGMGLRCEGGHAYKINGTYYLLYIEWPGEGNERRREICYRSDSLFGIYERKVILDDDMGYLNQGIAQGCIFDTKAGDWYAMLFQDHHAVGRIPHLLPVNWVERWPVIGTDGKAPECFAVNLPEEKAESSRMTGLVISDDFDYTRDKLPLQWQWNHNPDNRLWSVTERPGYLRLKTGKTAESIVQARNTLTQRTEGPSCEAVTKLDISLLKDGDCAGMVALQGGFGLVGIQKNGDFCKVVMCRNGGGYKEEILEEIPYSKKEIYLKIHFDFERSIDEAYFFYSEDGRKWAQIGNSLHMQYTLDHFMGYRIGLYCYATKESGGAADFDYFQYNRFEKVRR